MARKLSKEEWETDRDVLNEMDRLERESRKMEMDRFEREIEEIDKLKLSPYAKSKLFDTPWGKDHPKYVEVDKVRAMMRMPGPKVHRVEYPVRATIFHRDTLPPAESSTFERHILEFEEGQTYVVLKAPKGEFHIPISALQQILMNELLEALGE